MFKTYKIKIKIAGLVTIIAVLLPFQGLRAQQFKVDRGESVLNWEGKAVGKSHTGTIMIKSGSFTIVDGMPEKGSFVVDMNTIKDTDLGEAMAQRLEAHLKSDDFFAVETYPESKFSIVSSEMMDDGKISIKGNMTIRGKTSPVIFLAESGSDGEVITFKGFIEIDRTLFDVKFRSGKFFKDLGDKMISDIITITFELKANRL